MNLKIENMDYEFFVTLRISTYNLNFVKNKLKIYFATFCIIHGINICQK